MFSSLPRALVAAAPSGSTVWGRSLAVNAGWVATLAVHGLVTWLHLWFATDGSFSFGAPINGHYDLLADAFLAGQLHLTTMPSPELLALPDPYDPRQNVNFRVHDASLYDGKWYLYWGPVPGLIQAVSKSLTGLSADARVMQLLFGLGGCLGFWLVARELRDQVFPDVPDRLVLLVYLGYALGGANLFLQAQPGVYNEAILAGTCFTLTGCYAWLRGLAGGRLAEWQLALAGVLIGLGFGSRMTLLGFAVGAGLVLVWRCVPRRGRLQAIRRMAAFGVPSAGILALLFLYNYARFGSFTEFGTTYQLLPMKLAQTFDPRVAPANLFAYLLYPPRFVPHLPFVIPGDGSWLISPNLQGWELEQPLTSILFLAPLSLLLPGAVVAAARRRQAAPTLGAFVVAVGLGTLFALGALATWIYVAVRYVQDVTPAACLLGGVALWSIRPDRHALRWRRVTYRILAGALLAASLAAGLSYGLLNVTGRSREYLELAYRFDRVTTAVVALIAPRSWPAGYLDADVRGRRGGIFYPGGSWVTLHAPRTTPIRGLEVELLPSAVTRIAVEIDGQTVGAETISPGQHVVRLAELPAAASNGRMTIRLHFPDQALGSDNFLWPLKVNRLVGYPSAQERDGALRDLREALEERRRALVTAEQEVASSRLGLRDQEQVTGPKAAASSGSRADLDRAQDRYERALRDRRAIQKGIADLEADLILSQLS